MPHSLVLNLLPTSPIPPGYLTGKHLHALFLTLVSSVDQELGDRLHGQKSEKAFSLSPLQVMGSKGVGGVGESGRQGAIAKLRVFAMGLQTSHSGGDALLVANCPVG